MYLLYDKNNTAYSRSAAQRFCFLFGFKMCGVFQRRRPDPQPPLSYTTGDPCALVVTSIASLACLCLKIGDLETRALNIAGRQLWGSDGGFHYGARATRILVL